MFTQGVTRVFIMLFHMYPIYFTCPCLSVRLSLPMSIYLYIPASSNSIYLLRSVCMPASLYRPILLSAYLSIILFGYSPTLVCLYPSTLYIYLYVHSIHLSITLYLSYTSICNFVPTSPYVFMIGYI